MNKFTLAAAGAALVALSPALAAPITIDDFTTEQVFDIGSNGATDGVDGGGLIGGSRQVTLFNTDGNDGPRDTNFVAGRGAGRFESGASINGLGISSTFRVDYDGSSDGVFQSAGLGGIDANGMNNRISVDLGFVDGTSDITFVVWDTDGASATSTKQATTGLSGLNFFFPEFAGVNLNSVGSIRLIVTNVTAAADLNIDLIEFAGGDEVVVPVPAAAILFASGLFGFAFRRRRG